MKYRLLLTICLLSLLNNSNSFSQVDISRDLMFSSIENSITSEVENVYIKDSITMLRTLYKYDSLKIDSFTFNVEDESQRLYLKNCIINNLELQGLARGIIIENCIINEIQNHNDLKCTYLYISNSVIGSAKISGNILHLDLSNNYFEYLGITKQSQFNGNNNLEYQIKITQSGDTLIRHNYTSIKDCEIKQIFQFSSVLINAKLSNITGSDFMLDDCEISGHKSIEWKNINFSNLYIRSCNLDGSLLLDGFINKIQITETIIRKSLDVTNCTSNFKKQGTILLKDDSYWNNIQYHPRYYKMKLIPFSLNDKLPEKRKELNIIASINLNKKISQLFKEKNFIDDMMYADIYLKELDHQLNETMWIFHLDKFWWYFGYKKHRMPIKIIYLLALFAIFNFFWLKKLNNEVYCIEGIDNFLKRKINAKSKSSLEKICYQIQHVFASFIYTGFIFLGLKITLKNLKYDELISSWKVIYLIYFGLIYFLGLFCVAFLVKNYFDF